MRSEGIFFSFILVFSVNSGNIPTVSSSATNKVPHIHSLTNSTLPNKYYGSFELDHSENLDEYLTARGYSWLTRQYVSLATFKKVFDRSNNKYLFNYSNLTSKKDILHKNVRIGRKFLGEGLDGTKQEITFIINRGRLYEHHKPLEKGEMREEVYEYFFSANFLIQKMSFDGIEGKMFYKRYEVVF